MGNGCRRRQAIWERMEFRSFPWQTPVALFERWRRQVSCNWNRLAPQSPIATPTRMITVVIPAHNEADYLQRTLVSLQNQNYGWYEVIVVANGCRDGTVTVARGQCHRLVVLPRKCLGRARNLGARMARGELLLFLDADTTLEPLALRRIAEDFTPTDSAGTLKGRPNSGRWPYHAIYALKNFVHRWSLHPGSSGAILCWKCDFVQAGGFDEGLEVRENSDLLKRLKRFGKYKYISDVVATTSMRRYEQKGVMKVTWLWLKVWLESFVRDLHQRQYEVVR